MKTLTHQPKTRRSSHTFLDRLFPGVYKFFNRPESSAFLEAEKVTKIFIVDDDPAYLKALEHSIANENESAAITSFQTGEACLQNLKMGPDVVILDYYLNSDFPYAWNGMSILKHIKRISPGTKVIMISSQDSLALAIDCIEKGAYDYISKSRSAFARINKILRHISGDTDVNATFFQITLFILLVVIVALIAGFMII